MRRTINIIFTFLFLHSCLYGQLRIDVETLELPNVEKLFVEEISGDSVIYYFNDLGKVKVTKVYYSDYLGETHHYFYNADGKIEKELTTYDANDPDKTYEINYVYEYDSQNLLRKKIKIYDDKDSILYVYKSYNLTNFPTEYLQYTPDIYENRMITNLEYENDKIIKQSTLWLSDSSITSSVFKYNEYGDIIQIEGRFDSKRKSELDSLNMLKQTPGIERLKHFIHYYDYEYDKMGRPIKIFKIDNDKKIVVEKRKYFDKND